MKTQPEIGTPVYSHHRGFIYQIESVENQSMFLIGSSPGMEKIDFNAKIIYLKDGKGSYRGECENLTLDGIIDHDTTPATPDQLDQYLAEAEAETARLNDVRNEESDRKQAARDAFNDEHREKIPVWARGAIVASFDNDKCDLQSDYFHSSVSKSVILGFSKHTRDLFPEMRKHAANFAELADIIEAGKEAEHREKYSMGSGYYLKTGSSWCDGWRIHKIKTYSDEPLTIKDLPMGDWYADVKPEPTPEKSMAAVGEGFVLSAGTRAGFIQIGFEGKPSEEIRNELKSAKFRWSRHNKVWYGRENVLPARYRVTTDTPAESIPMTSQGDALRAMAETMDIQIDAKMNPACANQNPTPRRAAMAESMRLDGEKLQETQAALVHLADAHDAKTVPSILKGINSKALIDSLRLIARIEPERVINFYKEDVARLGRAGINTLEQYKEAAAAFSAILEQQEKPNQTAQEIRKMENDLIGLKIDGFFPTPNSVIDIMLDYAGDIEGKIVLEPSAGHGAIAERLRAAGADVCCIEMNSRLRDILTLKNFELVERDFLEYEAERDIDLIIMNPPFEKLADIDHVNHALKLLPEGGKLISVMGESVFFNSNTKAENFRAKLDELGAEVIELGDAFKEKGAGRIRTTGARSRLVIIDK